MKKTLLIVGLLITALASNAQVRNKTYNLTFADTMRNGVGPFLFSTGLQFRNDTLFIGVNSLIAIVRVENEAGGNTCLPSLRIFREKYTGTTAMMLPVDSLGYAHIVERKIDTSGWGRMNFSFKVAKFQAKVVPKGTLLNPSTSLKPVSNEKNSLKKDQPKANIKN